MQTDDTFKKQKIETEILSLEKMIRNIKILLNKNLAHIKENQQKYQQLRHTYGTALSLSQRKELLQLEVNVDYIHKNLKEHNIAQRIEALENTLESKKRELRRLVAELKNKEIEEKSNVA